MELFLASKRFLNIFLKKIFLKTSSSSSRKPSAQWFTGWSGQKTTAQELQRLNRVAFCKKKHFRHGQYSIDYGSIIVKKDKEVAIRITNIRIYMLLRFSHLTFDPNNLETVHRLSWVFGSRWLTLHQNDIVVELTKSRQCCQAILCSWVDKRLQVQPTGMPLRAPDSPFILHQIVFWPLCIVWLQIYFNLGLPPWQLHFKLRFTYLA